MDALFAYGTLLFPAVFRAVTGRALTPRAATLPGFVRRRLIGELFPAILEASEHDRVVGVAYSGLTSQDWLRLDRFEGALYERRSVTVNGRGAWTYVLAPDCRHRADVERWDPAAFERDHLAAFVARLARAGDPRARE